jgi:hypothetical protein
METILLGRNHFDHRHFGDVYNSVCGLHRSRTVCTKVEAAPNLHLLYHRCDVVLPRILLFGPSFNWDLLYLQHDIIPHTVPPFKAAESARCRSISCALLLIG